MSRRFTEMMRPLCTKCGERSVPGLAKGQGLCPYHWAEGNWGKKWADHCYPPHPAAQKATQ